MAHIQWGSTQAEQHAVLKRVVEQMASDLYDNGQPGLISRVETFMSEHNATEIERSRQHESNTRRLNIIIALLSAIAAYIGIIITVSHPFKSSIDPQKVFHSENQVVAEFRATE